MLTLGSRLTSSTLEASPYCYFLQLHLSFSTTLTWRTAVEGVFDSTFLYHAGFQAKVVLELLTSIFLIDAVPFFYKPQQQVELNLQLLNWLVPSLQIQPLRSHRSLSGIRETLMRGSIPERPLGRLNHNFTDSTPPAVGVLIQQ